MTTTPLTRPTRLADGGVNPPVLIAADVTLPGSAADAIESTWSPARQQIAAARHAVGGDLESSYWNWTGKEQRVAQGELSLVAVECEGDVQGLMALPVQPRPAVLTPGEPLTYVDYLEVSPWNQRSLDWHRRFLGVGAVLIAEAIIISIELGFGGRVGLHSLPQAEDFYASKCGLTRTGPDPGYHELVYFEYTEEAGRAWLAARNTG